MVSCCEVACIANLPVHADGVLTPLSQEPSALNEITFSAIVSFGNSMVCKACSMKKMLDGIICPIQA